MALLSAREAAFLSLVSKGKISESLTAWRNRENPAEVDYRLAEKISYGTCQMALALDWIAKELTPKKKLSLKGRQKALLRSALYQICFMDRIPLYAVANESGKIAGKYFGPYFAKFLNALLRRLQEGVPILPQGNSIEDLSVRLSYPPFFIKELLRQNTPLQVLEEMNRPAKIFYRNRRTDEILPMENLAKVVISSDNYIQNSTPCELMEFLGEGMNPKRILDMCAAPGGKLVWLYDHFPNAEFVANDPSIARSKRLKENREKYGISAQITHFKGEEFPCDASFDLIVIDAPCSNSGVLHKRPEARWRLDEKHIKELEKLQLQLLSRAKKILAPGGRIWYLTCSILERENSMVASKSGLILSKEKLIFPGPSGEDGGYGCCLSQNSSVQL